MLRIVESAVMKVYRFFFCGRRHQSEFGMTEQGAARNCKNNSEEDEDGGGERRPKVVSHSWWQRRKRARPLFCGGLSRRNSKNAAT